MDFMEAKLIDEKMGENEYVPAAKDNLILFMTLSAKLHRLYHYFCSAKRASIVSLESLVLSKMELGNSGKKCVKYQSSSH